MTKSSAAEQIQRVNMAVQLLSDKTPSAEVLDALVSRYGVSRRQAFRYLRQAQTNAVVLPVPAVKTVFTVKLPGAEFYQGRGDAESVAEFIRVYRLRNDAYNAPLYLLGESYGVTRCALVAEALRAYLAQGKRHG